MWDCWDSIVTQSDPKMTSGSSGGDPAKYCLKWNNFGRNVTSAFKSLLANEELVSASFGKFCFGGNFKLKFLQ